MEWVLNATTRPLYPRESDPVPILYESGWATGPVRTGAENLAPTGIRSLDRPAGSDSLYRLSYLGPKFQIILLFQAQSAAGRGPSTGCLVSHPPVALPVQLCTSLIMNRRK